MLTSTLELCLDPQTDLLNWVNCPYFATRMRILVHNISKCEETHSKDHSNDKASEIEFSGFCFIELYFGGCRT